jgi:hypothetical protein
VEEIEPEMTPVCGVLPASLFFNQLIAAGFPIPRKEFATGEIFAGLATGVSCSRDSCILQIVAAEIDICAGDTSAVGAHQRDGH